jgi:hypothetical protein
MSKKGRRTTRKGRGKSGGAPDGTSASGSSLVPFNVLTNLTDALKFPVPQEQIFRCVQSLEQTGLITSSGTAAIIASLYVNAASLCASNYTSFAAVFDQYKIDMVEVWITPNINAVTAGQFLLQPNLYSVLDYDDASSLANVNGATAYASCIRSEPYEKHRRCYRPRIAYAAYGGGAFTSYANQQAGWIDCASGSVSHYGIKVIVESDGNATGPHASWDVYTKAHLSFRATH